jgi:hypothetical protein
MHFRRQRRSVENRSKEFGTDECVLRTRHPVIGSSHKEDFKTAENRCSTCTARDPLNIAGNVLSTVHKNIENGEELTLPMVQSV